MGAGNMSGHTGQLKSHSIPVMCCPAAHGHESDTSQYVMSWLSVNNKAKAAAGPAAARFDVLVVSALDSSSASCALCLSGCRPLRPCWRYRQSDSLWSRQMVFFWPHNYLIIWVQPFFFFFYHNLFFFISLQDTVCGKFKTCKLFCWFLAPWCQRERDKNQFKMLNL